MMKSEVKSESTAITRRKKNMAAKVAALLEGELDPEWRARLELAKKSIAGDEAAISSLMLSMRDEPASLEEPTLTIGQQLADPVEIARKALLKAVYGDVKALQDLGRWQMEKLMHEIVGPNPSPLERLSAERIVFCWQQLFHYEKLYAAQMNKDPHDSLSFQREEFYQKRVARAQRSYEAAIKTLAQVRRLQLPTMQINIADKQINVGNGQTMASAAQVNTMVGMAGEE